MNNLCFSRFFLFCSFTLSNASSASNGRISLRYLSIFLYTQLLPFSLDSFHIWLLLVFLQKCTLRKPEGAKWPKKGEIQHEGKAVENVSKAAERVRKRKQINRIVSGRKSSKPSSTFPRRDRRSRGETANKSQDFPFFLSFFARGKQRRAC